MNSASAAAHGRSNTASSESMSGSIVLGRASSGHSGEADHDTGARRLVVGDQDLSVKTYTVNILDRDATIESSSVVSFEDSGRDSSLSFNPPITNSNDEDNQGSLTITPSKVELKNPVFQKFS